MRVEWRMQIWVCTLAVGGLPLLTSAQARPLPGPDVQQIYQRLLPQIEKIPMFDHHAHPGFADDPDVDAMASPPGSAALRTRDTNPELVAAATEPPYADPHVRWCGRGEQVTAPLCRFCSTRGLGHTLSLLA